MKQLSTLALLIAVLAGFSLAQVKQTDNTLELAEGETGQKAVIADVEWLTGSWTGTGLGGVSDEVWSGPRGGVMVGHYRLVKDDKPAFYEIMMIVEQEGTLVLRLKHFHANFVGWEEKDKTVDYKFVKKDGRRMYFGGLTFEREGDKGLKVYLALRQKDGTLREEIFRMQRSN